MNSSPACHVLPHLPNVTNAPSPRGGTLARLPQIRPGHFPYPSRTSPRAPCSVLLTRDARTPRGGVLSVHEGAIRAACMGEGEAFSGPLPSSSLGFHQAAHEFRAHDSNADQSLRPGGMAGAEGRVLRNAPPRPSIILKADDPAHERHSLGSSSRKREPNKEQFSCVQNLVAQ